MKFYIALFFVALAVLQCSSAPASDSMESKESGQEVATKRTRIVCEPETVFKVYCNTCNCNKDGTGMTCTLVGCNEDIFNEDGSLKNLPPTTEAVVVDGNTSADHSSEEKKIICEPGTGFRKECNHCSCSIDGTGYACTRMACPPGVYNDDGSLKEPESISNVDVVIEDADSDSIIVEATSESTSDITTEIATEAANDATEVPASIPKIRWGPLYEQGTLCPDKIFYSECNQCVCLKNGKTAGCTLILCEGLRKIYEMENKDATELA